MDDSKIIHKNVFYKSVIEYLEILNEKENYNVMQKTIMQSAIIDFSIWIFENKFVRSSRKDI